jgi:hypothetical protein
VRGFQSQTRSIAAIAADGRQRIEALAAIADQGRSAEATATAQQAHALPHAAVPAIGTFARDDVDGREKRIGAVQS